MGGRSAVIWAKLRQAAPQGGRDPEAGPPLPQPRPSPACRSIRDSNQTHNTVSFVART